MLLYQRTGSAGLTALLTAVEAVPYLCFGLFAGALADRWSRRRIMTVASWLDAALLATIPLAAALGMLTTAHLLVVGLMAAVSAVFFDAAAFGALAAVAGRDRLPQATSTSMSVYTIIGLAVPVAGGAVATVIGPAQAIALDALSFAVAATLLAGTPIAERPGDASEKPRVRAQIAEGLRFILGHPQIRALTLLGIGNSLTGGAVLGLLVATVVRHLGLADDDPRIGWFYAATAIGALAATMALPRLSRRFPVGWITLGGLCANFVLLLAWAFADTVSYALVALGLWQACNTLVVVNGILARQQATPDELQGRVNTTARMIAWGGQPLGATLAGGLAELYSVRAALIAMGCGVAVSFILGLAGPLRSPDRSRREEP
jgi:MFS family permease